MAMLSNQAWKKSHCGGVRIAQAATRQSVQASQIISATYVQIKLTMPSNVGESISKRRTPEVDWARLGDLERTFL